MSLVATGLVAGYTTGPCTSGVELPKRPTLTTPSIALCVPRLCVQGYVITEHMQLLYKYIDIRYIYIYVRARIQNALAEGISALRVAVRNGRNNAKVVLNRGTGASVELIGCGG